MTPSTLSLLLTATMMLSGCGKAPVDSAKTSKPTLANMKGIPCFACGDGRFMCGGTPREHADYCIEKPDKAAAPETAGPYTIIPLPKIVRIEPPPATHHPSLPTPKDDKPRKSKKRPDVNEADVYSQPCKDGDDTTMKPGSNEVLCILGSRLRFDNDGYDDVQPAPAMTPQQFTDWMNENLPAQTASHKAPDNTEICGSPGVCRPLTDADYMRLGIPRYPPDYKMPHEERQDQ